MPIFTAAGRPAAAASAAATSCCKRSGARGSITVARPRSWRVQAVPTSQTCAPSARPVR
jgi:hypothetical protein